MALTTNKLAAATAVAAAFSLLAAPVTAAELPIKRSAEVHDTDAGTVYEHRRWRGRDRDRYRDNDGIDAGDIIAGVLILGGIAAIAGAASKDREEPYPEPGPDTSVRIGSSMDRAVDSCVSTVEDHGARVASVDSATHTDDVWHVAGEQDNGAPWACWVDDDGILVDLEIDGYGASGAGSTSGQWSDEDYARARAAHGVAEPYPAAGVGG